MAHCLRISGFKEQSDAHDELAITIRACMDVHLAHMQSFSPLKRIFPKS
jgi:hypothetical protein